MKMRVRNSSANVFRDLGFGGEEGENLRLRADLMIRLTRLIDARRLTQARAARLFGVTQPRVSVLVRGRIERFSIDGLIEMLSRLTGSRLIINNMSTAFTRITVSPGVCTGKPCIRGLRFPVSRLLGLLAAGQTREEILKAYPYLESADINEALAYAASLAEDETFEIVSG